jgi:hypothetical protein
MITQIILNKMSGVRIYVATSATASGLILDGGRLDLFEDESIMLTLKQTDMRYCSEL